MRRNSDNPHIGATRSSIFAVLWCRRTVFITEKLWRKRLWVDQRFQYSRFNSSSTKEKGFKDEHTQLSHPFLFELFLVTVGAIDIFYWLLSHRISFGCWDFLCARRFDQPVFLACIRIFPHLQFQKFYRVHPRSKIANTLISETYLKAQHDCGWLLTSYRMTYGIRIRRTTYNTTWHSVHLAKPKQSNSDWAITIA